MRLIRLALATLAICFALFSLVVVVFGVFDYADCRGSLDEFHGTERSLLAWACSYEVRTALLALAISAALGVPRLFPLGEPVEEAGRTARPKLTSQNAPGGIGGFGRRPSSRLYGAGPGSAPGPPPSTTALGMLAR